MVVFVPMVIVPIFVIIFHQVRAPDLANADLSTRTFANFAACSLGFIFSIFFGLPLVLLHTGSITPAYFGYWIGATVIGTIGLAYYVSRQNKGEE